jgi:hypothetical protein
MNATSTQTQQGPHQVGKSELTSPLRVRERGERITPSLTILRPSDAYLSFLWSLRVRRYCSTDKSAYTSARDWIIGLYAGQTLRTYGSIKPGVAGSVNHRGKGRK